MNKIEILIITITIIYDKVSQIFWMKIYLNLFFHQLMKKRNTKYNYRYFISPLKIIKNTFTKCLYPNTIYYILL